MNPSPQRNSGEQGLACPACGRRFVPDPAELLTRGAINCPACGLELRVNRAESSEALEHLRKLHEAHERVRAAQRSVH